MRKREQRLRRARGTRAKIKKVGSYRLTVHRTPRHMYAQVIAPHNSEVVASASTLDREVKGHLKSTGNVEAASVVGRAVAERARAVGITKVAFDRSGFRYHGRVKALAEAARENNLEF